MAQPTAIEAELDGRGRDIADWHQGRMSSRKLLVLLRHSPEDGPYQTALRDGDWPTWVQMLKELHKEVAVYRASKYVGTEHEYEPQVFMSAPERLAQLAEEEADEFDPETFNNLMADVFGDPTDEGR